MAAKQVRGEGKKREGTPKLDRRTPRKPSRTKKKLKTEGTSAMQTLPLFPPPFSPDGNRSSSGRCYSRVMGFCFLGGPFFHLTAAFRPLGGGGKVIGNKTWGGGEGQNAERQTHANGSSSLSQRRNCGNTRRKKEGERGKMVFCLKEGMGRGRRGEISVKENSSVGREREEHLRGKLSA